MSIARGQVYWVALDPVQGSEQAKTRPCVVMSTTEVNDHRRTVIIIPLTKNEGPSRAAAAGAGALGRA